MSLADLIFGRPRFEIAPDPVWTSRRQQPCKAPQPIAGGQRSGREAHNPAAEGSTPSPASNLGDRPVLFADVPPGYERVRTIGRPIEWIPPSAGRSLREHLVLALPFFLHVHNILDEAQARLAEAGSCDLDEIAMLLASKLRENLVVVYGPPGEER